MEQQTAKQDSRQNKNQTKTVREQVDGLISAGVIKPESRKVLNSLMFLTNIGNYIGMLQLKISCAMHMCNQAGILAGVSGGKETNGFAVPLLETQKQYRKSRPSSPPPSSNLPTEMYALLSASDVSSVLPDYEDKPVSASYNHNSYTPYSFYRPKVYYKGLSGPPLAPSFSRSRVITNYEVRSTVEGVIGLKLESSWENILGRSLKGDEYKFMERHFEGRGVPQRDLRGATEYERSQIRRQIDSWVRESSRGMQ
jgi:hypothetical protein